MSKVPMSEIEIPDSAIPGLMHGQARTLLADLLRPNTLVGTVPMVDGGLGFGMFLTTGDGIVVRGRGLAVYHLQQRQLDKLVTQGRLRRADQTDREVPT